MSQVLLCKSEGLVRTTSECLLEAQLAPSLPLSILA